VQSTAELTNEHIYIRSVVLCGHLTNCKSKLSADR